MLLHSVLNLKQLHVLCPIAIKVTYTVLYLSCCFAVVVVIVVVGRVVVVVVVVAFQDLHENLYWSSRCSIKFLLAYYLCDMMCLSCNSRVSSYPCSE